MPTLTEKKAHFDRYWEERDLPKTDQRTIQRAKLAYSLTSHRNGKVLDVGCGRGGVSVFFKEQGFQVSAVDVSPQAVNLAKKLGISAALLDLEQEDLEGKYDLILCLEVLQFVIHPEKVLLKLKDALSTKGEIIVSLPNEFHLGRRVKILFGHPDFGGYQAPHLRLFYSGEIQRLLHDCGLTVEKTHSVSIIPPTWGPLSKIGDLLAALLPNLFALSILVRARRN